MRLFFQVSNSELTRIFYNNETGHAKPFTQLHSPPASSSPSSTHLQPLHLCGWRWVNIVNVVIISKLNQVTIKMQSNALV